MAPDPEAFCLPEFRDPGIPLGRVELAPLPPVCLPLVFPPIPPLGPVLLLPLIVFVGGETTRLKGEVECADLEATSITSGRTGRSSRIGKAPRSSSAKQQKNSDRAAVMCGGRTTDVWVGYYHKTGTPEHKLHT